MNFKGFILKRLSSDYTTKPFDCNDEDLNDFFINDASDYLKNLLAVTYLLESSTETVAFFSLLNDKISVSDVPSKRWWKKNIRDILPEGKRYNSYPAVKLGRLGVHKNYQNQGIGTIILDHTKDLFINNNISGCKFITVNAYNNKNSLNFYKKNGFNYLTEKDKSDKTRLLYYDLLSYVQ
ncbi:MAG: GNAT family N-acetyltransferase [Bacteroidetes bacterium]|nr:GNAT family N-acetyltransferase [Bacteroidota bacterium]